MTVQTSSTLIDYGEVALRALEWNLLAGNPVDKPEWEDIVSQFKVWFEEAKELHEAILAIDAQPEYEDSQEQL